MKRKMVAIMVGLVLCAGATIAKETGADSKKNKMTAKSDVKEIRKVIFPQNNDFSQEKKNAIQEIANKKAVVGVENCDMVPISITLLENDAFQAFILVDSGYKTPIVLGDVEMKLSYKDREFVSGLFNLSSLGVFKQNWISFYNFNFSSNRVFDTEVYDEMKSDILNKTFDTKYVKSNFRFRYENY